jgi:outer membrane protein TolC
VLVAFAQVADALKALEHDAEALQAQVDAQRAADEALALLQANYRAGLVAYVDVLVADVQAHQASIAICRRSRSATRTRSRCSSRWAAAGGTPPAAVAEGGAP